MNTKTGIGSLLLIFVLFVLIAVAVVVIKDPKESFTCGECGGCAGPSYLHSPWRWTYDCGLVKYA
jgi:hypothetical protein